MNQKRVASLGFTMVLLLSGPNLAQESSPSPNEPAPGDPTTAERAPLERNAAERNVPRRSSVAEKDAAEKDAAEKDAAEKDAAEPGEKERELPAGHSTHGEAFNEGPRQKAYLMGNTGYVHFPVTAVATQAQAFFDQGIGQLHGFWYFEAERSFRQVALLDPHCAMAYWGMAMANTNNHKRARGFIAEAVKLKEKATERERMYIDALDAFLKADPAKKKPRAEAYTKALEAIAMKYPTDVEARALLVLQLYLNRDSEMPIVSYLAVDALMDRILDVNPLHPVHHYRIHLWDFEKADRALRSAALCGQSAAGIAHMWHMPGHTYSRLKRYDDACFQQEASARVDHAHMMRDRVLPDQIHNFAHNNEWLIRDLIFVGRVHDAVSLAKNMTELPRHPKYNTLDKGSARFGRMRLFQVLSTYELWDELISLANSRYLEPTASDAEQIKRIRHLGTALIRKGDLEAGRGQLAELRQRLEKLERDRDAAGAEAEDKARQAAVDPKQLDEAVAAAVKKAQVERVDEEALQVAKREAERRHRNERYRAAEKEISKARGDARKKFDSRTRAPQKAVQELEGHLAVAAGDFKKGHSLLRQAGDADAAYLALIQLQAGETEAALKAIHGHVNGRKNEVQPLAMQVLINWQAGKRDEARQAFESLRAISGSLDMDVPAFVRLEPIARELGYPADWRVRKAAADDVGIRPPLDSLGPFRWQPSAAPDWTLADAGGQMHELKSYRGRPVVLIFYLGYSCLHCAEQLQKFAPLKDQFAQAGIDLLAISSDDRAGLNIAIGNYAGGKFPITLLSDSKLDVFRAYRCYDDFEHQPLHGTFLLDGAGRVRWQDISYEPFMDAEFLLGESQRLLSQDASLPPVTTPVAGVGAP
jgi:peroxiredoxin